MRKIIILNTKFLIQFPIKQEKRKHETMKLKTLNINK